MLWALNTLSSHPVAQEKLIEIAASFSSDAPFFFSMGTAYCQGRGELIQPVEGIPDTRLWVVKPKEGLSTPLVYKHCRPDEFAKRDPRQLLTELLMGKPHYFNDLEQAAFSLLPSLHRLKDRLFQLGFSHVTMTGSGTAFFCLGTPLQSQLDGVDFYPISFATRRIGNWYELPHV